MLSEFQSKFIGVCKFCGGEIYEDYDEGRCYFNPQEPGCCCEMKKDIIWTAQCSCGHLFIEKYVFKTPNDNGEIGFCWCGFCRKKRMVKLYSIKGEAKG